MNSNRIVKRPEPKSPRTLLERLANPRNLVFLVLFAVIGLGGGRRLHQAWRARRAIARLDDSDVTPAEVEQVGQFGRAGAFPLFQILSDDARPDHRDSAARALLRVWAADDLVAEEEQAIVRRLYKVEWNARRTYPRALKRLIPIKIFASMRAFPPGDNSSVHYGLLQQTYRILGTGQAAYEKDSSWQAGAILAKLEIDPGDFATDGPHRLVLQPRIRPGTQLNSTWELELPHSAFSFEFDRRLQVDALLSNLDESRRPVMEAGVAFDEKPASSAELGDSFELRDAPAIRVAAGLPCDVAHQLEVEFEGIAGRHRAGNVVISGERGGTAEIRSIACPEGLGIRPGEIRLRAILTPDAELGWTDPAIRSIWPGTIISGWTKARVLRK